MTSQFTLFYDGQFWCGLYEISEDGSLHAHKVVFGAEPNNAELYHWMLSNGAELCITTRATLAVPGDIAPPKSGNPKRLKRLVNKAQRTSSLSTRSQDCLHLNRELQAQQRKQQLRKVKEDRREERFAKKQEKRKAKKRGK
ncbi:YjdF family protein [Corynebacterium sp. H127]|uniref:YjdF family protein n=1 Tax=Corynebacterium sp. H127 TaxID=3133418 RepID=UPI0030AE310A